MAHFWLIYLLKIVIFNSYVSVSLPEGNPYESRFRSNPMQVAGPLCQRHRTLQRSPALKTSNCGLRQGMATQKICGKYMETLGFQDIWIMGETNTFEADLIVNNRDC